MTETTADRLALPLLPLDDTVVLPGMVVPIRLAGDGSEDARRAVESAQAAAADSSDSHTETTRVVLAPRVDGRWPTVGAEAVIEQVGRLPGGELAAIVRVVQRVRIGAGVSGPGSALWVEVERLATPSPDESARARAKEYRSLVIALLERRGAWQVIDSVRQTTEPEAVADLAGYASYLTDAQKLWLLETVDVGERLEKLIEWTREHLAELDVADTIQQDVKEGMERQQREFLLRQQLAAIRKELGELDGSSSTEEADYRQRVEQADLPDHVRSAALTEVGKLERTSEQSPEVGWIRTWLDTVLEMPWLTRTDDTYDVVSARATLDADHAGLDEVKERITEFLAVRGRRAQRGLGVVGGRRSGAAGAGRSAGSRQDLAGRVGGPGHGPQLRPGRPRRRP